MTKVYFVRHAQPDVNYEDDRARPLTEEGMRDSEEVTSLLKDRNIDYLMSSPYKRSMDTIKDLADTLHMKIDTDERFRERKAGTGANNKLMFEKRWSDFNYHEEDGECLADVQKRNISALTKVLKEHKNENIVIATHGTALSTILNYYDNSYNCVSFLKIIDYMPYIVRLDFDEEQKCVSKVEELFIEKEFR